MKRVLSASVLSGLAALSSGCGGEPRQLEGEPAEVLEKAATLSGVKGIPPLGWYRWGEDGYVTIPVLGIYHRKDFSMGFFGLIHLGTTVVERDAKGRATEVRMRDFNLAGIYNATERQFLEGDRLVRERARRILWFIPIGKTREEIPALAAGGIRGLPPFWFYRNNFLWHVTAPFPLFSHHSDSLNHGLVGVINWGVRRTGKDDEGKLSEVRWDDFNLLAFWNSTETIYREGPHAFRKRADRLFWFLPIN